MKHTAVIIGAGPAGAACGIRLMQAGVDCLLVDRQKFPREKLCAGLFTQKSQQCLKELLREDRYNACMEAAKVSHETDFALYKGKHEMVRCQPAKPIVLVNRPSFDEWLVEHYVSIGGRFRDGEELVDIDYENKKAKFQDMEVDYDFLIAADGANSKIGHILSRIFPISFEKREKNPMCLEINVDRADLDMKGVNIYFGIVPKSYAWVFSKGEQVCVGMVKLPGEQFNVNNAMRKFIGELNINNPQKYPLRGAMLPIGNYMQTPYFSDILFVGDAAGLVEPLTGEGIYYALQSGVYAAESVIAIESHPVGPLYAEKIEHLKRLIDKGAFYQRLLENKWTSNLFFRYAHNHAGFIKHFYETQIENACLDSFLKIVLKYKWNK